MKGGRTRTDGHWTEIDWLAKDGERERLAVSHSIVGDSMSKTKRFGIVSQALLSCFYPSLVQLFYFQKYVLSVISAMNGHGSKRSLLILRRSYSMEIILL